MGCTPSSCLVPAAIVAASPANEGGRGVLERAKASRVARRAETVGGEGGFIAKVMLRRNARK